MTTRRLAAILAADVVGFSKLIGEDRGEWVHFLRRPDGLASLMEGLRRAGMPE